MQATLPVLNEILILEQTPPTPGYFPPQRRMDLVATDSYFATLLAELTITDPTPGYFAMHRASGAETLGTLEPSFTNFLQKLAKELFRQAENLDADMELYFISRHFNEDIK